MCPCPAPPPVSQREHGRIPSLDHPGMSTVRRDALRAVIVGRCLGSGVAKGQWVVGSEGRRLRVEWRCRGRESDGPVLLIVPHLDLLSIWCQREVMDGPCRACTFQIERKKER